MRLSAILFVLYLFVASEEARTHFDETETLLCDDEDLSEANLSADAVLGDRWITEDVYESE